MKGDSQFMLIHEPRGMFICRFINNWIDGRTETQKTYSIRVQEVIEARTEPALRVLPLHYTDDAAKDIDANRQLIMRIVRGVVALKSDLEEPFVLALPKEQRKELQRRLAARYLQLAVPIPCNSSAGASADMSRALKEIGEWVEATGKLLAGDLVISEADSLQDLENALAEGDEAMAEILTTREAIIAAIKKKTHG